MTAMQGRRIESVFEFKLSLTIDHLTQDYEISEISPASCSCGDCN